MYIHEQLLRLVAQHYLWGNMNHGCLEARLPKLCGPLAKNNPRNPEEAVKRRIHKVNELTSRKGRRFGKQKPIKAGLNAKLSFRCLLGRPWLEEEALYYFI